MLSYPHVRLLQLTQEIAPFTEAGDNVDVRSVGGAAQQQQDSWAGADVNMMRWVKRGQGYVDKDYHDRRAEKI